MDGPEAQTTSRLGNSVDAGGEMPSSEGVVEQRRAVVSGQECWNQSGAAPRSAPAVEYRGKRTARVWASIASVGWSARRSPLAASFGAVVPFVSAAGERRSDGVEVGSRVVRRAKASDDRAKL